MRQVTSGNTLKAAYRYAYNGVKIGVKGADNRGYDYRGSFIYTRNGSSLTLESALFGGGRIVAGTNGYEVYYYLTDHLGSVRAVVDAGGNVKERNDYYLFGARQLKGDYPQLTVNREKFNGKESQTVGGLGFLDYGARMYDAALGKWMTFRSDGREKLCVDPLPILRQQSHHPDRSRTVCWTIGMHQLAEPWYGWIDGINKWCSTERLFQISGLRFL